MRAFWLALGFLSTLPVPNLGEVREGEMRQASVFYPAVGYIVGAILAGVGWLSGFLPDGVQGALLLGAWLWLTGMLHLDGLLDSADALLAMKSPSRRLQILSDVHLGSFAFGVGFAVLLLKWQLLASQPHGLALLCIPALVRFALLVPMQLYPAARPEGLGARAKEGRVWAALLWALPAIVLILGWLWGCC